MDKPLTWRIDVSPHLVRVTLVGEIGLDVDFAPLMAALSGAKSIEMDLRGVRRLNSCGIREWIGFIRELSTTRAVSLVRCSPAIVNQLNTLRNFTGQAEVRSIVIPFLCASCGHEESSIADAVPGVVPEIEDRICPVCGRALEFDDLPKAYFQFLASPLLEVK
jgi:hypothetical protein